MPEAEAFKMYLTWTAKLLDACYTKAKRDGQKWSYVQVTEKQKRGHPHSHILATFAPNDLQTEQHWRWIIHPDGSRTWDMVNRLRSDWLQAQVVRSGLGDQYDISAVRAVEGAARYVAKYMFKPTQFTTKFPPNWKRVRYAQSFPKLPSKKTDAFPLVHFSDWVNLASLATVVDACEGEDVQHARAWLEATAVKVISRKAQ